MAELWSPRGLQKRGATYPNLQASATAKQFLTGLWVPQLPVARDLVGNSNMVGIADRSLYSPGVTAFGPGLKSNGSSTTTAKGIYGLGWAAGTNTISGFAVVTLASLTSSSECIFFRNAGSSAQNVSFSIFPNTKTLRPLLENVAWATTNDRTDSSITTGVPWFFGFYYSPAEGFWAYSSPVGRAAPRIGTVIYSGSATVPVQPYSLYIGGAEYAGSTSGIIDGVTHIVGLSNKPVPRQWFESLSLNPWQLFAPQRQVSYFLPSTGITPVVSRRVWTQQPQGGVRVNWSNQLARGLVTAVLPSVGPTNLAGPERVQFGSPIVGAGGGFKGPASVIKQTGTQVGVRVVDSNRQRTSETTGFVLFRRTGTVDANTDVWWKNWQSNTAPSYISWTIAVNNGGFGQNNINALVGVSGGIVNSAAYTAPSLTDWTTAAIVKRSGAHDLYVNGLLRNTTTSGAITYGSSGDNDLVTNISKTQPLDIALALTWNRALTASEIAEITANPWQLFAPQQQVTYFGTSGGGTVYNLSISETSLTSDSISSIVTWFASLSETATVSDSPTTTVIFPTAISETATVSDSPSTTVIFPTAISETATANDSLTTTVIFPTAISETATGSDATASSFALSSAVSETATGNDITDSAFALASAVSETVTASDSSTMSLIANASVSETATASESVTTVLIIYPSISETATAADTITTIATLNVGVAETVTATDIVTGATTMTVTLSETATASDSVVVAVPVTAAIAETATASESVDSSLVYLGNISETATALDSISTIATQNVFVLETATAADSVTIGGSYQVSLSETVVAADAVTSRFLWEPIDTSQTPGWSNISTTQNANWSSITTTQTANWQPVNTGS